jgi:acyl carrier protein
MNCHLEESQKPREINFEEVVSPVICELIARFREMSLEEIGDATSFRSLDLDGLERVQILMEIESILQKKDVIGIPEMYKVDSISQICNLLRGKFN